MVEDDRVGLRSVGLGSRQQEPTALAPVLDRERDENLARAEVADEPDRRYRVGALVGIAALVIANNDAVVKAKQTADAIYLTNTAVQIAINATETAKSWTKTPTPTNTPTDTPTPTATNTPTDTITPSPTITPNVAATTQAAQQTIDAMGVATRTSVAQTRAAQDAAIQAGQAQISIARTALAPNQPQQTIAAPQSLSMLTNSFGAWRE